MSREPDLGRDGVPRLGAMLGRYRLDAVIGRGGMGVVFRAADERLDRTVAIKVLALDLAGDPQIQERFLREARLAAAIEHPHIVPVYEAASSGDVDYIAMRFVPGPDLGRVLHREGPLGTSRTLAICAQVADALDAAHAQGLIHRDVKPSNVLLEVRGEEWAWLTDFGLTKRMGGSAPPTRDGLAGTLEYLAPEAIEHGTVDGRSDQYALACLVYHCLAGTPPFGGTEAQVLRAHLHDEPPRLSVRDDVAGELDTVMRRALAKDPADRFPNCRAFAAELHRVAVDDSATDHEAVDIQAAPTQAVDDPPVVTKPPARAHAERLRPTLAAHRWRVLGALALAGGLAGSMYLASQPGRDTRGVGMVPSSAPSGSAPVRTPPGLSGPDGVIVFAGGRAGNFDIWAARADGTEPHRLTDDPAHERSPSVSADGSRIVFSVGSYGERDIYLVNADGSGRTRLTKHSKDDYAPAISPDGRSIAWTSDRSDRNDIWLMTDEGDGFDEDRAIEVSDQFSARGNNSKEPAWFPDGRRIAFQSNDAESADIWSVDVTDDSRRVPWTADLLGDHQPTVGPDGSIVFLREQTRAGDRLLYRVTRGDREPRLITDSVRNPIDPEFSPDGDRLVVAHGKDLLTMSRTGRDRHRVQIDGIPTATDPDWVESLGMP